MGIRPSTSDISSLFIFFLLFWFLQLWLTGLVGEILELKKVFYLFFVSVLSIPRNAFFVTRVAFVVLEFVFATPVCYVTNFLLFTVIHKPNESQGTQLITSLRSARSVEFYKPQRTRPSALPHMLILVIAIASFSSLYDSFPLFLTGNARLHSHLDDIPLHLPNPLNVFSWLAERLSAWSLHL